MLIDTHVHLNAEQYDEDLEAVIERARDNGVDRMFVVGFDTLTCLLYTSPSPRD